MRVSRTAAAVAAAIWTGLAVRFMLVLANMSGSATPPSMRVAMATEWLPYVRGVVQFHLLQFKRMTLFLSKSKFRAEPA
ncbi:MAG: hypothetical protein AAF926_01685 [Pseudomonadota bacterium]